MLIFHNLQTPEFSLRQEIFYDNKRLTPRLRPTN